MLKKGKEDIKKNRKNNGRTRNKRRTQRNLEWRYSVTHPLENITQSLQPTINEMSSLFYFLYYSLYQNIGTKEERTVNICISNITIQCIRFHASINLRVWILFSISLHSYMCAYIFRKNHSSYIFYDVFTIYDASVSFFAISKRESIWPMVTFEKCTC